MSSVVVKDDPAALRAAEEDVIMLELSELGTELVVADAVWRYATTSGSSGRSVAEVRGGVAVLVLEWACRSSNEGEIF